MGESYLVTILGSVGAGSLLIAFILLNARKIKSNSYTYETLNLAGAAMLIVYSYLISSYPFLVLNIVWFLEGIYGVLKVTKNPRKT